MFGALVGKQHAAGIGEARKLLGVVGHMSPHYFYSDKIISHNTMWPNAFADTKCVKYPRG